MKYQIREMTLADIPDVIAGEERIFGISLGYDLIYTDLRLNPYAYYFVLEIDETVQGYIGLWIEERAQIVNFYVEKAYQGLGFGAMILDFSLNLCIMSKAKNISLEVRKSNHQAIKLYEKYGFSAINVRPHYYHDGEDAIVMNKELEENK